MISQRVTSRKQIYRCVLHELHHLEIMVQNGTTGRRHAPPAVLQPVENLVIAGSLLVCMASTCYVPLEGNAHTDDY